MSELELLDIVDDGLGPLGVRFGLGLSVCMGDSLMALGRLIELASGARSPRRGHALYAGVDVRNSPQVRSKVACLLAEEELPAASEVRASLEIVLRLRRARIRVDEVLETWGLSGYAGSDPSRLTPHERRAIQLAFCLCDTESSLILLHDPLALAPLLRRDRIISRCIELSKERTIVVATGSLPDAIALGGNAYLLERGQLSNYVGLASLRGDASLRVRAAEAQRLTDALRADAQLHVRFDAHFSKLEFSVSGETLTLVAASVARIAGEHGIAIEGICAEIPALTPLLSARTAHFSHAIPRRTRFSLGTKQA